jgi:Kinesin motor domain
VVVPGSGWHCAHGESGGDLHVSIAGSERAGREGAAGQQLAEANGINKGLMWLGKLLDELSSAKPKPYINYRNTLLTQVGCRF